MDINPLKSIYMKKITLLFLGLISFHFGYSQDDCASALPVTEGITTVVMMDGALPVPDCAENADVDPREFGEWYVYTATANGFVNITTNLAINTGGDTRLHVYTGTCAALICLAGSDDIADDNFLSSATFAVDNGTSYYIGWDNQWSDAGFDFELTYFTCSYDLPYTETFDLDYTFTSCYTTEDVDADTISWITQQNLDLDGDGSVETFATNGNSTANTKNDWLFSPPLSLTGGIEYNVTSIFNTFGGNGSLEAFIVDAASSTATQIATLFSQTDIVPQGEFATLETLAYQEMNSFTPGTDGDYFIAYHSFGPASSGFILLFDSNLESLLSVDEFQSNLFTHFYNKTTDILSLESSSSAFDNVYLYNILGQQVKTQRLNNTSETVDMSSLTDGVYLVQVTLQGKTKTIKIIKH
jgi:hypothetical protein